MSALRLAVARVLGLFRTARSDRDTRDEFEAHLSMAVEENMRRGMAPDDARRSALNALGAITPAVEVMHRSRGLPTIEGLVRDMRYAMRALLRNPSFTIVAVATLSIGMGAITAIYSVVDGVLFRPLPYPDSERLVAVRTATPRGISTVSGPDYMDWKAQSTTFDELAVGYLSQTILSGNGDPERLSQSNVSGNVFATLRLQPRLGRTFTTADDSPQAPRVAVISESLWRSRFGSDSSLIGRSVLLDGNSTEIIGVVSDAMRWPQRSDVFVPTRFSARDIDPAGRGARWLEVVGRLREDVSLDQARAELGTIASRIAAIDPQHNRDVGVDAIPLLDEMTGEVRTPLLILLGAVAFVLLIACANVGSLTLGRIASRQTELALRSALGASRGQLVRQVLMESVVLALVGGALGLCLAVLGTRGLLSLAPNSLPRLDSITIDSRVLAFTFAVTSLTALIFGLVPALQGSVSGLSERLRSSRMNATATSRSRRVLVVTEVALALVLLAGAGLLTRSLAKLNDVDTGFASDGVAIFQLVLPTSRYANDEQQRQFMNTTIDAMRSLPGVTAAGASMALPFSGDSFGFTFSVRGAPAPDPRNEPRAQARFADAGYFPAMGIPLIRGRLFDERDRHGATQALIISAEVARRYFPDTDPIGQYLQTGWKPGEMEFGGEIIGIVGDVRQHSLAQGKTPHMYMSMEQWPQEEFNVVVRTTNDVEQLLAAARSTMRTLDPSVSMNDAMPMSVLVDASLGSRRFYMTLLAVFAGVALLLAIVGTYGVIAYGVQLRRRELGIRLALGATRQRVMAMVLREGFVLVAIGATIGLGAALVLTRLLESLLFEVGSRDPFTLASATAALIAVALLASLLPARKAAALDPLEAIRVE